ncbi:MAG TPA: winged helix-turn-helix domain-containing protein [Polyangiaceae bacterium]|nr:winged helix-turn-helix domain-containing protein [Polyangiaceae bacterium]
MNNLSETALQILPQETLPAVIVDGREPGGLEAAVSGALQSAKLRQGLVAVVLVPLGASPPPWLSDVSQLALSEPTDGLVLDILAREVLLHGQPVTLTAREFALLRYLYERRGEVVSRQALLREVWGDSYRGGPRTVDIHLRRLRAKLGADRFQTFRGIGYKLRRRSR